MMKNIKELMIVFLAAVMILSSTSVAFAVENDSKTLKGSSAYESDEPLYTGKIGKDLRFSFDEKTAVLRIKGNGSKMKSFKRYKTPWYPYASKIKTVKLSAKNLTNVSSYAFADLVKLKSVKYYKTLKKFSQFSFMNTKALKSIEIKPTVRSIAKAAFMNSGLKKITFKGLKTVVYSSPYTLPKKAKIIADNPSKAYNYAKKYRRATYIFLRKIKHKDTYELLTKGEKYACETAFTPENASNKKLIWYTTNKKVATVSQKGVVTGRRKGICHICQVKKR